MKPRLHIVVEEDVFTRMLGVVLDPDTDPERVSAFVDFFAHDVPDLRGWMDAVRERCSVVWPATVSYVESTAELQAALPAADAVMVESLPIGAAELVLAPRLRVVQKYGVVTRDIALDDCARRGIEVLTLRRRSNVACAELALMMMLALARRLPEVDKATTVARARAAGFPPSAPYDRRHTPSSNWARIPGMSMLDGGVLGIIGFGEIGREIALRARPFGMKIVYSQRTRLDAATEQAFGVEYLALNELLAASDWIVPQLPATASTHHLLDADRLKHMKHGARIVNVSRAQVMERSAVVAALRDGRLGGLGLDTLWTEPGSDDDELLGFPNVILTPHLGGSPRTNATADFEEMIASLDRALAAPDHVSAKAPEDAR